MMTKNWNLKIKAGDENAIRFYLEEDQKPMSFQEVFHSWKEVSAFTDFYVKALIDLNFPAFFWEHPALKKNYLSKNYECIIKKTNGFDRREVNQKAFAEKIQSEAGVEVFQNLGKNAWLVVPNKQVEAEHYKHMGSFIQQAPQEQIREQFKKVGEKMLSEMEQDKLIWLNTAGMGVIWLHMRLDTRPKYYKTRPYKNPDFLERK